VHFTFLTRPCRVRAFLVAAIAVAIWGVCGSAVAQPRPDVALHSSPDSVAPRERFTLTISASVPAHRAVEFPAADAGLSVFGDLTVLNRSPVQKQRVGAGYAVSTVTYEVMIAVPGSVRVPPLPVRVDAAVDTVITSTLPRTIYVTSGTGAPASHLHVETPSAPSRFPWTWVVLAGVAAGLLGGATYLWRDLRDIPQSSVPSTPATDTTTTPHDVAMRRLRSLQSRDLTRSGRHRVVLRRALRHSAHLPVRPAERCGPGAHDPGGAGRTRRPARGPHSRRNAHSHRARAGGPLKFADARPDPSRAMEALRAAHTAIEAIEDAVPKTSPADAEATSSPDTSPG